MPQRLVDRAGQRFGRLVVIRCFRQDCESWAEAKCDCGQTVVVRKHLLGNGTQSCGCLRRDHARRLATGERPPRLKHGSARKGDTTPEYRAWCSMIDRCENPKVHNYDRYGGRGISVHPAFRHDFVAFLRHIGPRPSPRHSVDRYPDPDGDYAPSNVRWATVLEQRHNRSRLQT